MNIHNVLQRVRFLKTTFARLARPLNKVRELPPIARIAALALLLGAIGLVIGLNSSGSDRWINLGIYLTVVVFVGVGLWLVNRALQARANRMSTSFDEELQGTEYLDDLKDQWGRAADELKATGVDRYNMAFYMLIGEPQSGKTTTLQKSGLNFPIGMDKIKGIGGTRNLDWWFTDEAIVLDTAGRLTFQEAETTDTEEWNEFLKLLQKYRPKCPINGVIVTIPCTSLLEDDAATRDRKANTIRQALIEIQRGLEVQFPVYVLLTKADKIGGFADFFGNLRAIEQTQLFGWSRPVDRFNAGFQPEELDEAFGDLVSRLRRWRLFQLERLADARAGSERDKMFPFPEEFTRVIEPLRGYLEAIFPASRLLDSLFFRGFYLTSGVQRGAPALNAVADILGTTDTATALLDDNTFQSERAFFIRDFYRHKVFKERGLIRPTRARVRKVRLVKQAGYTFASAAAIAGTLWVGSWYVTHAGEIRERRETIDNLAAALEVQKGEYNGQGVQPGTLMNTLAAVEAVGTARHFEARPDQLPVEGSGLLPDLFNGMFAADPFFGLAAGEQRQIKADLFRAMRVSVVFGLLTSIKTSAEEGLTSLTTTHEPGEVSIDGPSWSGIGARNSLELRLRGIEDILRAGLEQVGGGKASPNDLTGLLRVAEFGANGGQHPLPSDYVERVNEVYEVVRQAADALPEGVDALDAASKEWSWMGLSSVWTSDKSIVDTVKSALKGTVKDVHRGLQPPGNGAGWIGSSEIPMKGQGLNFAEIHDRLSRGGEGDLAGFSLYRLAFLEHRLNWLYAELWRIERRVAEGVDLSTGQGPRLIEQWGKCQTEFSALRNEADRWQIVYEAGMPYRVDEVLEGIVCRSLEPYQRMLDLIVEHEDYPTRWSSDWFLDPEVTGLEAAASTGQGAGGAPEADLADLDVGDPDRSRVGIPWDWESARKSALVALGSTPLQPALIVRDDGSPVFDLQEEGPEPIDFLQMKSAGTQSEQHEITLEVDDKLAELDAHFREVARLLDLFESASWTARDAIVVRGGDRATFTEAFLRAEDPSAMLDALEASLKRDVSLSIDDAGDFAEYAQRSRDTLAQGALEQVLRDILEACTEDLVRGQILPERLRESGKKVELAPGVFSFDVMYEADFGVEALSETCAVIEPLVTWLTSLPEPFNEVDVSEPTEALDRVMSEYLQDRLAYWCDESKQQSSLRTRITNDLDSNDWRDSRAALRQLVHSSGADSFQRGLITYQRRFKEEALLASDLLDLKDQKATLPQTARVVDRYREKTQPAERASGSGLGEIGSGATEDFIATIAKHVWETEGRFFGSRGWQQTFPDGKEVKGFVEEFEQARQGFVASVCGNESSSQSSHLFPAEWIALKISDAYLDSVRLAIQAQFKSDYGALESACRNFEFPFGEPTPETSDARRRLERLEALIGPSKAGDVYGRSKLEFMKKWYQPFEYFSSPDDSSTRAIEAGYRTEHSDTLAQLEALQTFLAAGNWEHIAFYLAAGTTERSVHRIEVQTMPGARAPKPVGASHWALFQPVPNGNGVAEPVRMESRLSDGYLRISVKANEKGTKGIEILDPLSSNWVASLELRDPLAVLKLIAAKRSESVVRSDDKEIEISLPARHSGRPDSQFELTFVFEFDHTPVDLPIYM